MALRELVVKGCVGAACTAVLTLVGAVVSSNREDAVQDQALQSIQQHQASVDQTLARLSDDLHQLDTDVALLNERLKESPSNAPVRPKR